MLEVWLVVVLELTRLVAELSAVAAVLEVDADPWLAVLGDDPLPQAASEIAAKAPAATVTAKWLTTDMRGI